MCVPSLARITIEINIMYIPFACRYVKEKPQTYTECLTQRGQYCTIDYNGIIMYYIAAAYSN